MLASSHYRNVLKQTTRVSCMVAADDGIEASVVVCLRRPLKGTKGAIRGNVLLRLFLACYVGIVMFLDNSGVTTSHVAARKRVHRYDEMRLTMQTDLARLVN
ncbi:hypothetical protein Tco_0600357 [Tanacetum coccineum]|uniref:Uncharacterized protein n=1 Tax=Tanacetum coccineum TaxID=301880 RepID=A0ABQ4WBH9_9ASTR